MTDWLITLPPRFAHAPHPVTGRPIDPAVATVVSAEDRGHAMEQAQALFGAHWASVEEL